MPTLSGQPAISLDDSQKVLDFTMVDVYMSKGNISPLHRQRVKDRDIVLTEEAKLQLVWAHKRTRVKPLPRYVLSKPFRDLYLDHDHHQSALHDAFAHVRAAALGLIRSYAYLIRHESDFNLAIALQLLPPATTWNDFARYLDAMCTIPDEHCSLRYAYGEIRLTRLNFYAPILLRRRYYHHTEYHYRGYFAPFYGPCLFIIGLSIVILTALQLAVQVNIEAATATGSSSSVQDDSAAVSSSTAGDDSAVVSLKSFCRFVGYSSTVITSVVAFYLSMLLVVKFCREWYFAIGERARWSEEALQERDWLHTKNSMV